jgi:hypothetical protein
MRVTVAGASGVVGKALVPMLIGRGHESSGPNPQCGERSGCGPFTDIQQQAEQPRGASLRSRGDRVSSTTARSTRGDKLRPPSFV